VYLFVFHEYIKEMYGSRSKIPSKNLVWRRCAEGFNAGFKGLKKSENVRSEVLGVYFCTDSSTNEVINKRVSSKYLCQHYTGFSLLSKV
jgi:hypothetical protein